MVSYIAKVGIHGARRGALRVVTALGLGAAFTLASLGSAADGASSCPDLPANVACHDSWMADMASSIAQRPISQVVIPGTHDSGTFGLFPLPIQTGESQTQDMSILQQLEHGIRSFDLRAEPNCVNAFHAFVCDDLVFFHGPDVTSASLYEALGEIEAFSLSHPKEIILLNINLQGAAGDALAPAFCQQFTSTLGGLLVPVDAVNPLLGTGGMVGTQPTVAPTTVQDIWDLGGPRIIANWSGGLSCASTPNTTAWSSGSFGSAYANQCQAGPYIGFSGSNPGAIAVMHGFLQARTNSADAPTGPSTKVTTGTAQVPDGTTALGFYTLQIQETKTGDCLLTGPNTNDLGLTTSPVLASDAHLIPTASQQQVLDNVLGDYKVDHSAHRNLNVLSADFPEWTSLMAATLQMNEAGPQIELAGQTAGGAIQSGDVVAEDVTLVATCTGDGTNFGVPQTLFFLGEGAISGPPTGGGLVDTTTVTFQPATETVVTAQCIDTGGKMAVAHFTVNSKVPPTVTARLTPPANGAGWNRTDVTVTLTAVDYPGGPGITGLLYDADGAQTIPDTGVPPSLTGTTTASFNLTAEGTTTVNYRTVDRQAIFSDVGTTTVSIDRTRPTITASATTGDGMAYTAGTWTGQDVTVTFGCTDALSGVAFVSPPTSVTTAGAEQSVTGACIDRAGNSARITFAGIDIDRTPPVVTYQIAGTRGSNDWYTSDVGVTWQVADPESPINVEVGCLPTSITSDTAGTLLFCGAHSAGGESPFVQFTIKRDATPPTVTYLGNAGSYAVTDTIAIACKAADSLSGVASTTCADVNGPAYSFGPGVRTFSATATDGAGNVGRGSTRFHVDVTQSGLCQLTTQLVEASSKYQSLAPMARAVLDREARDACAALDLIVPRLTPKQKAAYVAAYDLVVQRLAAGGWLNPAVVSTLQNLAGAL